MNNDQQIAFTTQSESFASFLRHTDQKSVTQRAIIDGLQRSFPSVWKHLEDPSYEMNILYVGVGNGGVEIPLTKQFINIRGGNRDRLNVYCEDPSEQMRAQFYEAGQKAGVLSVIQEYDQERLETYQPPSSDLIVVSHVMYYVEQWDSVLLKLAHAVKERRGAVLLTLQSEKSDNFYVRTRYAPSLHPGSLERSGEEITTILDRFGINNMSYIVDAHTDVRECFQRGIFHPTVAGKQLLTFILRTPWDTLSSEIQEDVAHCLSHLVERNHEQTMIFRDLYVWMRS